jgi:hypothetical protein
LSYRSRTAVIDVGDQGLYPHAQTAVVTLIHHGDEVVLELALALRNDQPAVICERGANLISNIQVSVRLAYQKKRLC